MSAASKACQHLEKHADTEDEHTLSSAACRLSLSRAEPPYLGTYALKDTLFKRQQTTCSMPLIVIARWAPQVIDFIQQIQRSAWRRAVEIEIADMLY
jgi:hypothetical protein